MLIMEFHREFRVRWGDMDFNAHMRNTAYLDLDARRLAAPPAELLAALTVLDCSDDFSAL